MEEKMKEMHALGKRLELNYGVLIDDDALFFAHQLLQENEGGSADEQATMELVERACHLLRQGLDSDSEEINLDWDEYCFDRAFVELMELKKEKSVACRSVILPLVEKELTESKAKLDCFQNKWASEVAQLRHESERRVNLLKYLHHELVSLINVTKLEGYIDLDNLSQLLSRLSTAMNRLQHTIRGAFKERLIVGPREVAKAASPMFDLPLSCFNWPFKLRVVPRIVDLKSRLSKKLIGLDDVIHKIAHSLSKQKKSTNTPFGSFLLLGPYGCGRTRLAKALAEEIFGDKQRFIKLDMSKYSAPDNRSSLLYFLKRDKKHGSVVLFDNVEKAHTSIYEVLSEILMEGSLSDGKRMSVNFSDDLVFVSSHVCHEVFCYCRCLRDSMPKIPFREVFNDPAILHAEFSYKTCYLHQFYTEVINQFKLEFVDLFNDVVVFPFLTPQNHMSIIRLQTRDVATSLSTSLKKQIILYPSDAALKNVLCYRAILERGAHAYETWHKVYMDPMLHDGVLKNEADDMIIVYIDAFVGSRDKFSFRVENSRHLQKCPLFMSSKQSFQKLRSIYRREKLQMNRMYRLNSSFFDLLELMSSKTRVDPNRIFMECQDLVRWIDDLLMNEPSDSNEPELLQLDDFNGEIQGFLGDKTMEGDKMCIEHDTRRLRSLLEQKDKATQVIIEPLLRRLSTSYDHQLDKSSLLPASFLCLGLTPERKNQFEKSLDELLVMDDGKKLLFQVDLSLCTEPASFFRCAYVMNTHLLLTKAVKETPHCVIVFHRLEQAHISVFSTILSILDYGVCMDKENNTTNFGNSVVVIISDLGNKEMIGGLNGHHPGSEFASNKEAAVESSPSDNMEFKGLRFELLYRLDQLLLFDPFSDEQLNQFAISPMKSLEEKSHSLYYAFLRLFDVQGLQKQHHHADEQFRYIEEALGEVVKMRKNEARVNDPKISEDAPEMNPQS